MFDIVIVGAGAAGLATAIFAARRDPGCRVLVLDGARRIGAKILVSGGGRCNVTNREVTASDFNGGDRRIIASVLQAFPAPARQPSSFEGLASRSTRRRTASSFPTRTAREPCSTRSWPRPNALGVALAGEPSRRDA